MIVKAGILIDLGNSETRAALIVNNKMHMMKLSNKFAELPKVYRIPNEHRNDKSSIFCVNGTYFANGQIVEREFVGVEIRPTAVQPKTEQLVTELSLNLVFMKALLKLSELFNVDVGDIDATFKVSVLLPPLEHEVYESKLIEKVKQFTSVNAIVPSAMTVQYKISEVGTFPEGVAAFFAAYFNEENGALIETPSNLRFGKGYVLVLDIGAGTTDVVLILDTTLVQNSKDTFKIGGNTVESIVRNEIKKKFGFNPKSLDAVIATGVLTEGTQTHLVMDILDAAKDKYSKALMEQIRQYLERMMLDMPEIKGVLVIGGGSLPSVRGEVVVSSAMADVLLKYLKKLAPNISMVDTSGKNPRDLNILGLGHIHKYS